MNKATHIFVLILVLGLVFLQVQNKALIKELQVKLDEVGEQCVVAGDVEPMIIIGVPEEEK